MTRAWWVLLAVPALAPLAWLHWDTAYWIFGGDTPTWLSFHTLIEWHFPHLWDEFDGAGHPFANNVPLPTALFFWILWKLAVPMLFSQALFFVALSTLAVLGFHRIGRLFLDRTALPVFVLVASTVYLLNSFGFYGENRRIFTTEFLVAYDLLPLFVSFLLTALQDPKSVTREALLAALASIALHNFNLTPAISYVGVAYLAIAVAMVLMDPSKGAAALKFLAIMAPLSLLLVAYHLFAMTEYYRVSSLASDLGKILLATTQSSSDLLVRSLTFIGGGREISSPWLALAYLVPLMVGLTAFFVPPSRPLALAAGALLVASLFFMDAGALASRVFSLDEVLASFYRIFRYPHIKFTAPYILAVALLCGLALARFRNARWLAAVGAIAFVALWNPRAFSEWLPIQLHRPDDWLQLSRFAEGERDKGVSARTLKIPSMEYFHGGVGGEEFDRTPPHRAEGAQPWMVHSSALGLLVPAPLFSLDMTTGARLNPCVTRIFRGDLPAAEIRALLENLGIARELLAKRFTYQDQFTPRESKVAATRLVQRIRNEIPHGPVVFENGGLALTALAIEPRPLLYVASRAHALSAEALAGCRLPPGDGDSGLVAYYAGTQPGEAAATLGRTPLGQARAEFARLAPGNYRVSLTGLDPAAPILLVLNNTYADWALEVVGRGESRSRLAERRLPVNGFATGWVIDPATACGDKACQAAAAGYRLDLLLSYGPQRIYQALLLLAITAALGIVAAIAVMRRERVAARAP